MTLILSCLTNKYAIQVSDRRLVQFDGTIVDDHANKAILVNGNIVFGYTGLAYVDNGKTKSDEWFLDALNEAHQIHPNVSLTTTAEYIAEIATKKISSIRTTPSLKRLAFVGIGWGRTSENEALFPIYMIISNAHNKNGKWLSEASPKFSVSVFNPPNDMPVMLVADGQSIDVNLRKRVLRQLKKCIERDIDPKSIARILVELVRKVASSNPKVGRNLLVNSIPKTAVHHGAFKFIGSYPRRDVTTFAYIPENTTNQVQYGPHAFAFGVSMKDLIIFNKD